MIKQYVPTPLGVIIIVLVSAIFYMVIISMTDSFFEVARERSYNLSQIRYTGGHFDEKEKEGNFLDYETLSIEESAFVKEASNLFALKFYDQIRQEEENIFFSPYSISTAFSMIYEGARTETAKEMQEAFNFHEDDRIRRMGSRELHKKLNVEDGSYELQVANAIWVEENYELLQEFTNTVKNYYLSEAHRLDFTNDPNQSRETINEWVAEKTNDLISDLFPPGSINTETKLALTNAIYFKGDWKDEFDEDLTRDEDFYITPTQTVQVPMMRRTGENYDYYENEQVQVLRMPYKGEEISMIAVLPQDQSLTSVEENLTLEKKQEWRNGLADERVDVFFPKFELDTDYTLLSVLERMGVIKAFAEREADFSGIEPNKELFITSAVHDAFITVDEAGTEAAAATGIGMGITSVPVEPDYYIFRADQPFLFFIEDDTSGHILFMGRVSNPS